MHGGPLWEPLCYAQIGGLSLATFIELLLAKVFYATTVQDLKLIDWAEKPAEGAEVAAAPEVPVRTSLLLVHGFACYRRLVAHDRSNWPIRRYQLGAEPSDDLSAMVSAEDRLRMMWPMAREGWALAGRSLPVYRRSEIPMRLYRAGERRDEECTLTTISGVSFDEVWASREGADLEGSVVPFIGREALLRNKRAAGRPKDIADAERLKP